jgi:RimJ/RimL family protein N-acetyltransferase
LNADPEVMAHLLAPLDAEQSDAFVARIRTHWDLHGFGLWAVERQQEGDFIGFVGLQQVGFDAPFVPAVEVGWRLARSVWGSGYASEAARAGLAFAFETLALDEVVSFTVPANLRSRAVMERIGMQHDAGGDFKHPRMPVGDALRPHVLYRLRHSDWG